MQHHGQASSEQGGPHRRGTFDATQYRFTNCNFVGLHGVILKGTTGAYSFSSCYTAVVGAGSTEVILADHHSMTTASEFYSYNLRCENQTAGGGRLDVAAFRTKSQFLIFEWNGDLSTNHSGTATSPLICDDSANATGSITFTAAPADGDYVVIGGMLITFKASGATGDQVNIGADANATGAALAAFLSALKNRYRSGVGAINASGVVTLMANGGGASGNATTLMASGANITVSGATLSGGITNDGVLNHIRLRGSLVDANVPLLHLSSAKVIEGALNFNVLGDVPRGCFERWTLDNMFDPSSMVEAVGQVARSGSYKSFSLGYAEERLHRFNGVVSRVLGIQGMNPVMFTTTGGSLQKRATVRIPAGLLSNAGDVNVLPRLKLAFYGECSGNTNLQLQWRQDNPALTSSTKGGVIAGTRFNLDVWIKSFSATSRYAFMQLSSNNMLIETERVILDDWDISRDFFLDLFESHPTTPNAISRLWELESMRIQ